MVQITINDDVFNVNITDNVLTELKEFLTKYETKKMPNIVQCYNCKKNEAREAYRKKQCRLRNMEYDGKCYIRKKHEKKQSEL